MDAFAAEAGMAFVCVWCFWWSLGCFVPWLALRLGVCSLGFMRRDGREKASGREREALAWKGPLGRSPSGSVSLPGLERRLGSFRWGFWLGLASRGPWEQPGREMADRACVVAVGVGWGRIGATEKAAGFGWTAVV